MARSRHGTHWALALGVTSACGGAAFTCKDDDACEGAGAGGLCEPTGFCSLPDDDCPSGRRYGDYAGDGLAGECVDVGGTSTGELDTSGAPITLDTTASSTVTSDASSSSVDAATSSVDVTSISTTTGEPACPTAWWDCTWSHRMTITLAPMVIPPRGPVPVLVRLGGDRWDPSTARDDASDLRFIDPQGNVLAHEIEQAGDPTIVWLSWPPLDDLSAAITVYWGNPDAEDAQDPDGVWDDGHAAVWHLTDLHDSTGAIDLDDFGTQGTPGAVGGARMFDGEGAYLRSTQPTSLGALLERGATIEAIIHPQSFGQQGRGRIVDHAIDDAPSAGWTLRIRNSNPASSGLHFERARTLAESGFAAGDVIELDTAIHVAMVWSDGAAQLFVDGEGVVTELWEGAGQPVDLEMADVAIGRVAGSPVGGFDGWIDEVRVSTVARDPSWIAWQYRSAVDTALAFGDVESWR